VTAATIYLQIAQAQVAALLGRALLQLVAIDDCARIARHVVEDAALDKRVYAGVTEQDQRRTIIIAARIARDLPSLRALRMFLRSFLVRPSYLARHQSRPARGHSKTDEMRAENKSE